MELLKIHCMLQWLPTPPLSSSSQHWYVLCKPISLTSFLLIQPRSVVCYVDSNYDRQNPSILMKMLVLPRILFSNVFIFFQVFGFLTKPLVRHLLPHAAAAGRLSREPTVGKEDLTLPLLSMEESASTNLLRAKDSLSMLIDRPVHTIHGYWRKFDDHYMRPMFGGPQSGPSAW